MYNYLIIPKSLDFGYLHISILHDILIKLGDLLISSSESHLILGGVSSLSLFLSASLSLSYLH